MTTFGDRARELMAARDISLRELAKRTFYDKAHLSRVLNGHKPAGAKLAARLDAELAADGSLAALAAGRLALADEAPHRVDSAVLDSVAALLAATRRLEDVTSAATVLPAVREYLTMVERFAADADSAARPLRSAVIDRFTPQKVNVERHGAMPGGRYPVPLSMRS